MTRDDSQIISSHKIIYNHSTKYREDNPLTCELLNMKCSCNFFLSPLKGQCQYQALIGLLHTTRLTGGFDCLFSGGQA